MNEEPDQTPEISALIPLEHRSAIALRYDPDKDKAPTVVAAGQDFLADQIIATAKRHHVPIREDKSLASALSGLDCGRHVPPEMYRAVAEVITWVFRMEKQGGTRR
jgi:flagellar biosynthesis protein